MSEAYKVRIVDDPSRYGVRAKPKYHRLSCYVPDQSRNIAHASEATLADLPWCYQPCEICAPPRREQLAPLDLDPARSLREQADAVLGFDPTFPPHMDELRAFATARGHENQLTGFDAFAVVSKTLGERTPERLRRAAHLPTGPSASSGRGLAHGHAAGSDETVTDAGVRVGTAVRVKDVADGREITYRLTTPESQHEHGDVSSSSPIAKSLLGYAVGDRVVVALPNGCQRELEVLEITS